MDIWERGYTFPAPMLASFKEKLNAPPSHSKRPSRPADTVSQVRSTVSDRKAKSTLNGEICGRCVSNPSRALIDLESTTPEGSPAPGHIPFGAPQQQQQLQLNGAAASTSTPAAPDTSSILKALADMAKQNTAAPAVPSVPAQTSPLNVLNTQSAAAPPVTSSVDQASQPPNGQAAVNPYAGNLATPFAALSNVAQTQGLVSQSQTPNPLAAPQNPLAALLPQATAAPAAPAIAPEALQQVQLLQLLAAQGIPQEQWATALQILSLSNNANAGVANLTAAQIPGYMQPPGQNVNAWGARTDVPSRDMDRDRERDRDYMRSPPGGYRRRSRSPGWDRRRDVSPPRRRDSPVYGEYHGDSPGRRGGDPRDARRRGTDYRQRSPAGRRRRTPTPPRKDPTLPPPGPKFVEWDYSIGQGNIKGSLFLHALTCKPVTDLTISQFSVVPFSSVVSRKLILIPTYL